MALRLNLPMGCTAEFQGMFWEYLRCYMEQGPWFDEQGNTPATSNRDEGLAHYRRKHKMAKVNVQEPCELVKQGTSTPRQPNMMQPSFVQGLVAALVRCFAIYLGLMALRFAVQGVSFWNGEAHFLSPVYFAISTLLFAVVALALWRWHIAVAGKLLPREMGEQVVPAIKGAAFEAGLMTAVGLYVTVMALPRLVHHGAWLFSDPELLGAHWVIAERAGFVGALVQLCLGVVLLLRAPGLQRLIGKLRTMGS